MSKFKPSFKKIVNNDDFSASVLIAVVVCAVVFVNVIIYTLATTFGWYFTKVREDDFSISDSGETLFSEAMAKGLDVEVIFCMYEADVEKHDTGSFVLKTAKEFEEKYPEFINLRFVNIITKMDEDQRTPFDTSPFEKDMRGEETALNKTSVIFRCGSNYRVITDTYTGVGYADFYTLNSDMSMSSYNGEEVFTAMIGWVLSETHGTAYVTVGHGETASVSLHNNLTCAGYYVEEFNLRSGEIPDDGELVVISNPRNDFEKAAEGSGLYSEIEYLRAFADRGGSFMVFIDPEAPKLHNLEGFVSEFGIALRETEERERLTVKDSSNAITTDGFTLVAEYSSDDTAAAMLGKTEVYGGDVIIKNAAPLELSGAAKAVLLSSSTSVAEAGGDTVSKDGSFPIAAVSYKENADGERAEMFVCGSIYFSATDAMITNGYSNKDFLYSLYDVCFEKGNMPYGCNSVIFDDGTLENLTMGQARWYTVLLIAIPTVLAAVGLVVMIRRKNR